MKVKCRIKKCTITASTSNKKPTLFGVRRGGVKVKCRIRKCPEDFWRLL